MYNYITMDSFQENSNSAESLEETSDSFNMLDSDDVNNENQINGEIDRQSSNIINSAYFQLCDISKSFDIMSKLHMTNTCDMDTLQKSYNDLILKYRNLHQELDQIEILDNKTYDIIKLLNLPLINLSIGEINDKITIMENIFKEYNRIKKKKELEQEWINKLMDNDDNKTRRFGMSNTFKARRNTKNINFDDEF